MPDILTTADIMLRYRCERHTAANIIRKLPSFRVGNRLFVKQKDLLDWEESRIEYPAQTVRQARQTGVVRIPRKRKEV